MMDFNVFTLMAIPVLWSTITMVVANLVAEKVSSDIKPATKVIIWVTSFAGLAIGSSLTMVVLGLQGRL